MYFLLKMGIFHWYVILPEGSCKCFYIPAYFLGEAKRVAGLMRSQNRVAWKMRVSFLGGLISRVLWKTGRSTIVLGNFNWFQGFCWKLMIVGGLFFP